MPISKEKRLQWFWNKVHKQEGDKCWLWLGYVNKDNGCGKCYVNGVNHNAARAAWLLLVGEIPENLHVCHTCDNRVCVRLDHLFLGTQQVNLDDMVSKGRSAKGARNARFKKGYTLAGDRSVLAKVTNEQAEEIRSIYGTGPTLKELGERYGIHLSTVSLIVNNKTFKKEQIAHGAKIS